MKNALALPTTLRVYCDECDGEKNCDVKARHIEVTGDGSVQRLETWHIYKCRGCDHTFLRRTTTTMPYSLADASSEGSGTNFYVEREENFPRKQKRSRPPSLRTLNLCRDALSGQLAALDSALNEFYAALDLELQITPPILARTIFDICAGMLGVDGGLSFKDKLQALVDRSLLGKDDMLLVAEVVEAGSAAAHRGWQPTAEEVETVAAILEHFLAVSFVEPAKVGQLRERSAMLARSVPRRRGTI